MTAAQNPRPSRSAKATKAGKAAAKAAAPGLGSQITAALERTWAKVQAYAATNAVMDDGQPVILPDVVFTTGSGVRATPGGIVLALAHIRFDTWEQDATDGKLHEMFVSGESLAIGAEDTIVSILHEAAHLVNKIKGIQDTARYGQVHNRDFVVAARIFGMDYQHAERDPALGYSDVQLDDLGRSWWADEIAQLEREIKGRVTHDRANFVKKNPDKPTDPRWTLTTDAAEKVTKVRRQRKVYRCQCDTPRTVAMFAEDWRAADVTCEACGSHFA